MDNSIFTAVSGALSSQSALDVVANNISNVNTTGFKESNPTFADVLSQELSFATSRTNPLQIGAGSKLDSTSLSFTQGPVLTTNDPTDFAISGSGFFVVSDGTNTYYTRDGSFSLDSNGNLVTADGLYVQGTNGNINIDTTSKNFVNFTVKPDGSVYSNFSNGQSVLDGKIMVVDFINKNALINVGGNNFSPSVNSGNPVALSNGYSIIQNALEGSNTDLATQMANLIDYERTYQVNAQAITTSDSMLQTAIGLIV
ncbi:flagellar hook-basal body protein [Thermodesulfobium narugense DSM 14796]|uniref:Flagellar hook-basal body protein n=1 Tax=Thermodesulfobium narugense DSM 14796 TaxID=747365 RepID=M1E8W7_9BACT|nr:flagellar basal-body rod protein FlgF [Thermodesulfobium narugense]AEE15418.1 flagellar hook-basal body protein [Thermodesulfobium narugense DSM 14796]